jgi:hypothetical protein
LAENTFLYLTARFAQDAEGAEEYVLLFAERAKSRKGLQIFSFAVLSTAKEKNLTLRSLRLCG